MSFSSNINQDAQTRSGKQALIVIGMHRSGTSATTGALQCLGIHLGEKLYSGHQGVNSKGYFEHSDIADTNEEALLRIGSAWDDILIKEDSWWKLDELRPYAAKIRHYIQRDFSNSALWAVKDPRVCRLLPWWLEILASENIRPYFLFVIRSPYEVYKSLSKRDGFSLEKSFLLWTLHYLEAERESRSFPRAFMLFDKLLESPIEELERVEKQLGICFPVAVEKVADELHKFLSKDLRHHSGQSPELPDMPIVNLACELEEELKLASSNHGKCELSTDPFWYRLKKMQREFDPVLIEQLLNVARHRGQVELTIHRLVRSWSWYTGKPVRYIERLFGRDV